MAAKCLYGVTEWHVMVMRRRNNAWYLFKVKKFFEFSKAKLYCRLYNLLSNFAAVIKYD